MRTADRGAVADHGCSMTALDLADDELGGILAYYSTHHTPPEALPVVFTDFHRTLAPGGHLMVVGRVGNGEHRRERSAYGNHPAYFESYLLPADRIAELLGRAGLVVTTRLVQEPAEEGKRAIASFLAHNPDEAPGGQGPHPSSLR
ncbi:class I SAM-dependent methyltransferase [Streptomyces atratus]|nr:class I SAM-dependent methyltransferase [Streptomyces atratus]